MTRDNKIKNKNKNNNRKLEKIKQRKYINKLKVIEPININYKGLKLNVKIHHMWSNNTISKKMEFLMRKIKKVKNR